MTAAPRRLRILHLAFEDHARPGSGGGGVRTREINRRLSGRHDLTVVTSRYKGARRRIEDGVVYRPLGLNLGHLGSMATYHLAIPFYLFFRRPDLVVEDFAAPVSSALVPLWTRQPTLAVVQWLSARETSRRYHLPFWWFEEAGMRLHTHFVAVSLAIAGRLREAHPEADIRTVFAGVECPPDLPPRTGTTDPLIVYLGRIELEPKGLDLLIEVVDRLRDIPRLRLLIVGDGPHRQQLESLVRRRDVGHMVEMLGRVEGKGKWDLLSAASVLVVPSRYESFGLVAAEAAAVGLPVVAWALPSLEEILGAGGGVLVPPFDVDFFAEAVRSELVQPQLPSQDSIDQARSRFSWDRAAEEQEQAYLAAAAHGRAGRIRLRRICDLVRTVYGMRTRRS